MRWELLLRGMSVTANSGVFTLGGGLLVSADPSKPTFVHGGYRPANSGVLWLFARKLKDRGFSPVLVSDYKKRGWPATGTWGDCFVASRDYGWWVGERSIESWLNRSRKPVLLLDSASALARKAGLGSVTGFWEQVVAKTGGSVPVVWCDSDNVVWETPTDAVPGYAFLNGLRDISAVVYRSRSVRFGHLGWDQPVSEEDGFGVRLRSMLINGQPPAEPTEIEVHCNEPGSVRVLFHGPDRRPVGAPVSQGSAVMGRLLTDLVSVTELREQLSTLSGGYSFPAGVSPAMQFVVQAPYFTGDVQLSFGQLAALADWYGYVWGCPEVAATLNRMAEGVSGWYAAGVLSR